MQYTFRQINLSSRVWLVLCCVSLWCDVSCLFTRLLARCRSDQKISSYSTFLFGILVCIPHAFRDACCWCYRPFCFLAFHSLFFFGFFLFFSSPSVRFYSFSYLLFPFFFSPTSQIIEAYRAVDDQERPRLRRGGCLKMLLQPFGFSRVRKWVYIYIPPTVDQYFGPEDVLLGGSHLVGGAQSGMFTHLVSGMLKVGFEDRLCHTKSEYFTT